MPRYAVYYAPAHDDPLWRFGSAALGYDAARGEPVDFPASPELAEAPLAQWTAEPRRYGFHATLKPPFRLATQWREADLVAALADFARDRRAVETGPLAVTPIGAFIALAPARASAELHALAGRCVEAFDRFRAPMGEAERSRRLASSLSARQIAQLDQWGYPYVFEDFRFHMTLSGPLADDDRSRLAAALAALYRPIAAPLTIDAITLFRQSDDAARFVIVERFAFGRAEPT